MSTACLSIPTNPRDYRLSIGRSRLHLFATKEATLLTACKQGSGYLQASETSDNPLNPEPSDWRANPQFPVGCGSYSSSHYFPCLTENSIEEALMSTYSIAVF
jgi:hypothetical protein